MHIAIVTNRFAPYVGGIERQMALVGRGLADRGHQVTVLTRRYDSTLPRRERLNGLTVERFGPSGQGVIAKWLVNLGTFRRLALRKPSFDCVLVTQFSATIMGPALARAIGRGAPLVLRPIEQGEFTGEVSQATLARLPRGAHGLARTALRMTRRMAYSQAKVLVVPSTRLIREAEGFGFPPDSIIHVPNPVDTSAFRPATTAERRELRAALGIPQDAEVVTYSGRLVAGKGLLTLARAWKDLVPMHPRALLVIIGPGAGPDSPLDAEQALRQYVTTEGMQDRVILTGARNDVERYLAASDVFAFPSVAEGFGNSLVEAMACGLPVICSRGAGGASDLIQEGEQGLKFDAENPASLCAGLHQLLSDEAGCKRMGAASRRLVEERSGLEAAVDSYERAIRRAIERN